MAYTRAIEHNKFDSRRMPRNIFFSLKFVPIVIILLAVVLIIVMNVNSEKNTDFTGSTVNGDVINNDKIGSTSWFASPIFYFVCVFIVVIVVMAGFLIENRKRKKIAEHVEYVAGMDIDV